MSREPHPFRGLPDDAPAGMSGTPVLEAESLSRRDGGRCRLEDFSLRLERGDVVALLGLNGAGKSTAMQLLAGVLIPDSGRLRIAGIDAREYPLRARAATGYLPDEPPLFEDMRVEAYLRFCARLHRIPRARRASSVDRAISRCDLEPARGQRIATLSRGWRQRVGLAQAIVHEPPLVLLDEPANGLDPEQTARLADTVRALADTSAVLLSTHLLAEAASLCTRVAIVHRGRKLEDAPLGDDDLPLRERFRALLDEADATESARP